jgi:hypothetical protein
MTIDELLNTVCPSIGSLGAAYYFTPETLQMGKDLGLDGFRFYFIGRGGVLGDVEAPVVASAFGYFEAGLVERIWNDARQVISPRDGGRAHVEAARSFGRSHFADVVGLDQFCTAAETVVRSADPAGLTLFAGLAAEPLPDDAPARAMQLVATLRELRGSVHLLAVVASGLSPKVAHYMRRPDFFSAFGWGEDDVPHVTDEDRARQQQADQLTDRLLAGPYSALDGAAREALVTGVERMSAAITAGQA